MTTLAATLSNLMQQHKLSSAELARRTGIGQPVIHRIANGTTDNPKLESLRPIANYFSITLNQLIGEQPLSTQTHSATQIPILDFELQETNEHTITELEVSETSFAIRITDTSLEPRFPLNSLLVIDPTLNAINGDFVLARCPDTCIKQLEVKGPRRYLNPLNIGENSPLNGQQQILGVMVQAKIFPERL